MIFFILKQNTKKKNSLNCIKRKRNSSIKFYFFLRGGARQEEEESRWPLSQKFHWVLKKPGKKSAKKRRQKTLAKLEGIALLSLLGAALKNKFFFLFLYVFKRKLLVKFWRLFFKFQCFFVLCFVWEKSFLRERVVHFLV